MLCQNCGKNEVNFRYTQIINGVKKEMALCDRCAKSLGLESLDFNMPINFSSFLGDFLHGAVDSNFLPNYTKTGTLQCDNCKMTYEEFIDNGKFGCSHCYDIFAEGLDSVLRNIHGSSKHIGRKSRLTQEEKEKVKKDINKINENNDENISTTNGTKKETNKPENKLDKLNIDLKLAVQEERYEDAAKIRDEIKKNS